MKIIWKEVEALEHTESPYYIERAVSALTGMAKVKLKNGLVLTASLFERLSTAMALILPNKKPDRDDLHPAILPDYL